MFGMEIRERLLAKDEENRVITYSVVEGVPIDSHTATISVEPEGDGSKVIWAYDVTPDEMAPIFGDTYKAALDLARGHLLLRRRLDRFGERLEPPRRCRRPPGVRAARSLAYPDPVTDARRTQRADSAPAGAGARRRRAR